MSKCKGELSDFQKFVYLISYAPEEMTSEKAMKRVLEQSNHLIELARAEIEKEEKSKKISKIVTVSDLICELRKFNPKATVCIGDNFNNRVSLGWSGGDGGDKEHCWYVCLDDASTENKENPYPADMDPECIPLCNKLNELSCVETTESCCGHLKDRFQVWFRCNDIDVLSILGRCVERNYSDGKWELLVDSCDTNPHGLFWLRSKEPFKSYEEMRDSVWSLMRSIDHWTEHEFDDYFAGKTNHRGEPCV
jgi:hypothetical protein